MASKEKPHNNRNNSSGSKRCEQERDNNHQDSELAIANDFYIRAKANSGVSRPLKRSYLEKALAHYQKMILSYGERKYSIQLCSLYRNVGMASWHLAQVVDCLDANKEILEIVYFLNQSVAAFIRALQCKGDLQLSTAWGLEIIDKIDDCLKTGFDRCDKRGTLNELEKAGHVGNILAGLPEEGLYDLVYGHIYMKKSMYYFKNSVIWLEKKDYVKSLQYLEYSKGELRMTKDFISNVSKIENSDIHMDIQILESDIQMHLCICDSLKARSTADELFAYYVMGVEKLNMEMMWHILDLYKESVLLTRERDVENEAISLSRMGRMYDLVLKNKIKTHKYYRKAFDLAHTLHPKDFSKAIWFIEARRAIKNFQKITVLEEQKKKDEERKPVLKELEKELNEIKENSMKEYELLTLIYTKYPPKVKCNFNIESLNKWDEKEGSEKKNVFKLAISHYHPDKQAQFGLKWLVLCEEITKYLTMNYEGFKGI